MALSTDLALAHQLADLATDLALQHFGQAPSFRAKPDGTPVSVADLAVEAALVDALREARPDDSVMGEEEGQRGDNPRRWILDPIDGTATFLAQGRSWGTHIALETAGQLQVVIVTRPTENTRWWAALGQGAYTGANNAEMTAATRLRVSRTTSLAGAKVSGYLPDGSVSRAVMAGSIEWIEDEICPIGAVAEGRIDAMLDEGGHLWDQAPAALIIPEAGGTFSDRLGEARIDTRWNLYSNGLLQNQLHALLIGH